MSEEKNKNEDKLESRLPGVLTQVRVNDVEREILLDYLNKKKPMLYADFLFAVMGNDFIKFIDVLEGLTLKVPQREQLVKIISYIKIYSYLRSHNFSSEAYERASKLFNKREVSLRRIVANVENTIKGEVENEDTN